MEIIRPKPSNAPVKAVLLDFDGTISTLRHGWEEVMAPLMAEHLGSGAEGMVREYIDASTGIQTVFQMKWLADRVRKQGGSALGVAVHVDSGTDHPDVMCEAEALGLIGLFDSVSGAPLREEACSKEKVMRDLARDQGLMGAEVCVIGDGKVEIGLGRELGARCLGIASDEARCQGVYPAKRERLIVAGAEAIAGDFLETDAILAWMNLER